jgi:cob(I)alamin adenosyltransferase
MTSHSAVPDDAHRERMQRRKEIQDQRVGNASHEKGLVIVHTGSGKGKTTAAFGMALRTLGHGRRVAIIQFIKGTRDTGERRAFAHWGEQLRFHAVGEGFTWETQDHARDVAAAVHGWDVALRYLADPDFQLVVLDEVNVALRLGHLTLAGVLDGIDRRPTLTHVVLTGRGASDELIERADLVSEMKLVKHPFKSQGVHAQPGIEF